MDISDKKRNSFVPAVLLLCLVFALVGHAIYSKEPVTRTPAQPGPPVLDATASIIPGTEDCPPQLADHVQFPRRGVESSGEFLMKVTWGIDRLSNVVAAGEGTGPSSKPVGRWTSTIRYVIYKSPKDARTQWGSEDYGVALRCKEGSFSGRRIGDLDSHLGRDSFRFHFVCHNVSVRISAQVEPPEKPEALSAEIQEALEATAQAIVNRIDRVVQVKGSVGRDNLPPYSALLKPTGPSLPADPGALNRPRVTPASPPPVHANSWIVPDRRDFASDFIGKASFGIHGPHIRVSDPFVKTNTNNALGAAIGATPYGRTDIAYTRYVIYKDSETARTHWKNEEVIPLGEYKAGSYSGLPLGDSSEMISDPETGVYVLGFLRHNVSVHIVVKFWNPALVKQDRKTIEETFETTAHAILRRIDGVVAAKGEVDMSNLPKRRVVPKS